MTPDAKPDVPKLCVSPREAARALSVSERTLFGWTVAGQIPSFIVGRRRFYSVKALQVWIDAQGQLAAAAVQTDTAGEAQ